MSTPSPRMMYSFSRGKSQHASQYKGIQLKYGQALITDTSFHCSFLLTKTRGHGAESPETTVFSVVVNGFQRQRTPDHPTHWHADERLMERCFSTVVNTK
jgi:hypothetical protein